ncbi:MAG: hypothetical protein ACI8W7_002715 [Gammaproteobacteria bacterium]|jgi:hypothetical protein
MTITNSRYNRLLLSVCIALFVGACGSTNSDLVRCNENPDIDNGCGAYKGPDEPEWKETTFALPPLPRAEDLRSIDAFEANKNYDYLLDRASISGGSDGVMRYSVVVRSPSGKQNIFHEGIRCLTTEARTLAYASTTGVFVRSTSSAWKTAADSGVRGYQSYLAHVIMCDRHGHEWTADKAVAALDAQFTADGVRVERECLDLQSCVGSYRRHDR